MNPDIYFDFNTDNPSQTQIERARCKFCDWKLEYTYPVYGQPWIDRFKEDAYKHTCQKKSAQSLLQAPTPRVPAIASDRSYGKGPNSKSFPSAAGRTKKLPQRKKHRKTGSKR